MELNKINYRKSVKPLDTTKKPIKSWQSFTWLAMVVSKAMMCGKIKKLEKINMDGVKPPY